MKINECEIVDTFAEAFSMRFTRIIVTAIDRQWLSSSLQALCGYGTSIIGCDAEVGVEQMLDETRTVDGRPGASVLLFAFNQESLAKALANRIGQTVMTCPTTAVYNGLESAEAVPLGSRLRFFGDGYQKSKVVGGRRYWRIPVMDGEFLVEDFAGVAKGIAGGNFLIQAIDQRTGLNAAANAVAAISSIPGVITPFPGGVVRSGSKVGSKYKRLVASTAQAYCPTLVGRVGSQLHPLANCVYEIVIDGQDRQAIERAMAAGISASIGPGIPAITAGNYGGKLGKQLFHLRELALQ